MPMAATMRTELSASQALLLAAWLSPSFPVGAFSYSHGLETAVEKGLVRGEADLQDWLADLLAFGSGRNEAILFRLAWRAADDPERLCEIARLAASLRGSAELALESEAQGDAFLRTVLAAWPDARLGDLEAAMRADGTAVTMPVAAAACCRCHGLPEMGSLTLYLHAFIANLVSAGVRLIPLGQTAGQRVTAGLEGGLLALVAETRDAAIEDIGSAGVMAEICAMQHEIQYTRLFRS